MEYQIAGVDLVIVSVVVVYLGVFLTRHISVLQHNNIPSAVTGGIITSCIISAIYYFFDIKIIFDMDLRNILLLTFFSTIGLSAKFYKLVAGGKALVVMVGIATVFLFMQDLTGVLMALMLDMHPAYGLFVGSISLAGGHGTAIAWGAEAAKAGLPDAEPLGIACATFGLIVGGLIGGPIAARLIRKNKLLSKEVLVEESVEEVHPGIHQFTTLNDILTTVLILSVCLAAGEVVNIWLFERDILLPGFLTAMFVGVLITNVGPRVHLKLAEGLVATWGDVSLQLFLAMSLMSLDLTVLTEGASGLFVALMAQSLLITLFTMFIVFRVMGRDYDAAVIASGFAGMGMGATPVAIGNMNAVTSRFGPSTKAFLVVPLIGAFFIDVANAIVIKFFVSLPLLQQL
jgi:ESS family glutamate:Na+ symporter